MREEKEYDEIEWDWGGLCDFIETEDEGTEGFGGSGGEDTEVTGGTGAGVTDGEVTLVDSFTLLSIVEEDGVLINANFSERIIEASL